MLAAMIAYVLSDDLAWRPSNRPQPSPSGEAEINRDARRSRPIDTVQLVRSQFHWPLVRENLALARVTPVTTPESSI